MCASFWRLSTQIKELGDTLFCVCWFVSMFESYYYMVFKSSDGINVKDLTKTKLNGFDTFFYIFLLRLLEIVQLYR